MAPGVFLGYGATGLIRSSTFTRAYGSVVGGCVSVLLLATLEMRDSLCADNTVLNPLSVGGGVSAMYTPNVLIVNSSFLRNTATNGGGVASNHAVLACRNCTIRDNLAVQKVPPFIFTVFPNASAVPDKALLGQGGGAIAVGGQPEPWCTLAVGRWCTVARIEVSEGSVVAGNGAGVGGGVSAYAGDLVISGSLVSGNFARENGGGVHRASDGRVAVRTSEVSGNRAGSCAGVEIRSEGEGTEISDSVIRANFADGAAPHRLDSYSPAQYGSGGGLCFSAEPVARTQHTCAAGGEPVVVSSGVGDLSVTAGPSSFLEVAPYNCTVRPSARCSLVRAIDFTPRAPRSILPL